MKDRQRQWGWHGDMRLHMAGQKDTTEFEAVNHIPPQDNKLHTGFMAFYP